MSGPEYNYTEVLREPGSKWEIHIDPVALYGYTEHDEIGEGGGLWFKLTPCSEVKAYEAILKDCKIRDGNYIELCDFDGLAMLPQSIIRALRKAGYYLDSSFDPYNPEIPKG